MREDRWNWCFNIVKKYVTWRINAINMSIFKRKQFIITRKRRATHVINTRDTR
jgi:hypothetical protein